MVYQHYQCEASFFHHIVTSRGWVLYSKVSPESVHYSRCFDFSMADVVDYWYRPILKECAGAAILASAYLADSRRLLVDDDSKNDYCESKLDKSKDDMKILQTTIKDNKAGIAEGKDTVATLTNEIAALLAGIKEMDSQVGTATANQKAENAE